MRQLTQNATNRRDSRVSAKTFILRYSHTSHCILNTPIVKPINRHVWPQYRLVGRIRLHCNLAAHHCTLALLPWREWTLSPLTNARRSESPEKATRDRSTHRFNQPSTKALQGYNQSIWSSRLWRYNDIVLLHVMFSFVLLFLFYLYCLQ